jgi:hypothetical protein
MMHAICTHDFILRRCENLSIAKLLLKKGKPNFVNSEGKLQVVRFL